MQLHYLRTEYNVPCISFRKTLDLQSTGIGLAVLVYFREMFTEGVDLLQTFNSHRNLPPRCHCLYSYVSDPQRLFPLSQGR